MSVKLYFSRANDEFCYPIQYHIDYMVENGIMEMDIFEAKIERGTGFFYCKALDVSGESGISCGKKCDSYVPRNSKNGICKNHAPIYSKSEISKRIVNPNKNSVRLIDGQDLLSYLLEDKETSNKALMLYRKENDHAGALIASTEVQIYAKIIAKIKEEIAIDNKNNGETLAKVWNAFKSTDNYKRLANPETISLPKENKRFLENRLNQAFFIAWDSAKSKTNPE